MGERARQFGGRLRLRLRAGTRLMVVSMAAGVVVSLVGHAADGAAVASGAAVAHNSTSSPSSVTYAVDIKGVGTVRARTKTQPSVVVDAKDRVHVLSAAKYVEAKPNASETYDVRSLKTGRTTRTTVTFKDLSQGPFQLSMLPGGRQVLTMVFGCGSIYTSATPAADTTLKAPTSTGIIGDYCGEGDADNQDHEVMGATNLSDGQVAIAVENLTTNTPDIELYVGTPGQKFALVSSSVPGALDSQGDTGFVALAGRSVGSLRVLLYGESPQPSGQYLSRLLTNGTWSTPLRVIDTPPASGGYGYLALSVLDDNGVLSVLFERYLLAKGHADAGWYSATTGTGTKPTHLRRVLGTGPQTTVPAQALGPNKQIYLLFARSTGLVEETSSAAGWISEGLVVKNRHVSQGQLIPRPKDKAPLILYLHANR